MKKIRTIISALLIAGAFSFAVPAHATTFDLTSFVSIYDRLVSFLSVNTSSQLSQVVTSLSNGLVGYWTFDEGSGMTAGDSSGNGNTGTLYNSTSWSAGKIRQALSLDGVDDRVIFSDNPFNFGTNSFSVSFWIKPTDTSSSNEKVVLSKVDGSLASGWRLSQIGNVVNLWVRSGPTTVAAAHTQAITNGDWTNVTFVVNQSAGTLKAYANGTLGGSASIAGLGSFDTPGVSMQLSGYRADNDMLFKGGVDDMRIYNRALSDSEVSSLYTTGNAPQVADTQAPTTPGNLTSSGISDTQGTLSWLASSDNARVAGYKIYRNGTLITTLTSTLYTDTSLAPATSYTYTVSSYDDAGNISAPASVTFKTSTSNLELAAGTANQISQYGITWFFDKAYPYGTFANGDYWVLGPVTIVKITPAFNGVHNGYDVNPVFSGPQGYDIGAGNFSSSDVPSLPYIARPGDSIVKAISKVQDPAVTTACYPTCLQTAAVLTVVGSVPVDGGATLFRPPYVGSTKTLYSIKDIRTDLLPSLPPVSGTPSLDQIKNSFARVQLDHKGGLTGRVIKPVDNLPDYGGAVAVQVNDAALRLMLNDPLSQKMPALINFIQAGIDRYHAVLSGQNWPDGGGHEPGRKLSLAFAAVLLNNQGMKDVVKNSKFFSEDIGIRSGKNGALFGFTTFEASETAYWNYLKNDPGYNLEQPDPYGYIDGGMNDVRDIDGYQSCCLSQPWKASGLVALLVPEIATTFNSSNFFEYIDRWANVGVMAQPDPCAPLSQGGGPLLDSQGRFQKKCVLDPDLNPQSPLVLGTGTSFTCQVGKLCGRYPLRHGTYANTGLYDDGFQLTMWDTYRRLGVLPSGTNTQTQPPSQPPVVPASTPTPTPSPTVTPASTYGTGAGAGTAGAGSSAAGGNSSPSAPSLPSSVGAAGASSGSTPGTNTSTSDQETSSNTAVSLTLIPTTTSVTVLTPPNDAIKAINTFLNREGFLKNVPQSINVFSLETEKAVQDFQRAYAIVSSGNPLTTGYGAVGPRTRAQMNSIIARKYASPIIQTPASASIYKFTRSLTINSKGNDVMELQKYLNNHGFIVATSGAGSPLHETTFFGPATQRAVIKFQVYYHITPAVGYFGPLTQKKLQSLK